MNASDQKDVKKAAKTEKRTRIQELGDVEWVLQTPSGRRFFWRLMEFCGIFELSHTRGDTHQTAFHEGMRNVGLKMMVDLMEAQPEAYLRMREENFEEADNGGASSGGGEEGTGSETGSDDHN